MKIGQIIKHSAIYIHHFCLFGFCLSQMWEEVSCESNRTRLQALVLRHPHEVTWGDWQTVLSAYITCAPLSQPLIPPVHQRLRMTRPSYGSVPHVQRERGGREGGEREWERAGEVRETGRGPSAVMNTESNSRLSQRRMSHLARHCAVNETEWGGTPAGWGCRVCERGPKALHTHWRDQKKTSTWCLPQILSMKVGQGKTASHRLGGNRVYDKKVHGVIGVTSRDNTVLLRWHWCKVDLLLIKATTLMFSQGQIGEPDTERK